MIRRDFRLSRFATGKAAPLPDLLMATAALAASAALLMSAVGAVEGPPEPSGGAQAAHVDATASEASTPFAATPAQVVGYRRLAEQALAAGRFSMAHDFEDMADRAARFGAAPILAASDVLNPADAALAESWRKALESAFARGAFETAPDAVARAEVAYNCFVRAGHLDGDAEISALCAVETRVALDALSTSDPVPGTPAIKITDAIPGDEAVAEVDRSDPSYWAAITPPSTESPDVAFDPLADDAPSESFADIETGAVEPVEPAAASAIEPVAAPKSESALAAPSTDESGGQADAPAELAQMRRPPELVIRFGAGATTLTLGDRIELYALATRAADAARDGHQVTLVVIGHADAQGPRAENFALSEARAQAAAALLVQRRDERLEAMEERGRVTIVSGFFGEDRPAGSSAAENRRVEVFMNIEG